MKGNDKRNAQHELYVLGFVADEKHSDEHSHRATEKRQKHKRFFGHAKLYLISFGNLFVINAKNYGNQRNYQNVCGNNRERT